MRRVRIDLAYDGTDFAGWQLQARGRTIQGTVEEALSRLDGARLVRVHAAGRTDAGVHARGQVAHADVRTARGDAELGYALHRLLPPDVRPLALRTVRADFDARRDALGKCYVYRLDLSRYGDPLLRRYALHCARPLDLEAVSAALRLLPGRRDWSGFAAAGCAVSDRVRELRVAELVRRGLDEALFRFAADGFLTHMVRNLVGTLLEIGRGRLAVQRVHEILASGDRRLAGPTAPARGLCLERVAYADENEEVTEDGSGLGDGGRGLRR